MDKPLLPGLVETPMTAAWLNDPATARWSTAIASSVVRRVPRK